MAATKRPTGQDLRRQILDTARSMLVREGYHTVSMRKIAGEIGCSATSIYLYFKNKDALIHALIEEGMEKLGLALEEVFTNEPNPEERLRALCREYIDFGTGNPEYYEVMFVLHPERMERYPVEKYRRARKNLQPFIDTLQEIREDTLEEIELAVNVLWAFLHGVVALLIARRIDGRIDTEQFVEIAVQQAAGGSISREMLSLR